MPDLSKIIDAVARLNRTLPDGTRSVVALVLISAVWFILVATAIAGLSAAL